jgi:hypothetical protein
MAKQVTADPLKFATVFAFQAQPGMLIDLEGDLYADPSHSNVALQCEYATVLEVEQETERCVCVYFDHGAVGFPFDHALRAPVHQFPAPDPDCL